MTIVRVDGFDDQNINTTGFDSTHTQYNFIDGAGQFSFVAGRNGMGLKAIYDGVNARYFITDYYGGTTDQMVGAFYFRVPSAPSVTSIFFRGADAGSGGGPVKFNITSGGLIQAQSNAGTVQNGPSVANDAWHRVDFHLDCSTTTHTVHWAVDGVNQTDATGTGTAGLQIRRMVLGSPTTTHTLTITLDDLVLGDAAGDYKIAGGNPYNVELLELSGDSDKTHGGVNVIEDQAGNDIDGVSNAYLLLTEMPRDITDYIKQVAVGASNYAEFDFENTSASTIYAVSAVVFGSSEQIATPNGTSRIVDSGGATLVDVYSGDMGGGSTNTRSAQARVPDPGGNGWTQAELNGVKCRIGFSSNASASVTPYWIWAGLYAAVAPVGAAPRPLRTVTSPLRW